MSFFTKSISKAHQIISQNQRSFATKICIIAGSQSYDIHGARIMKQLKALSKEDIEFFGVGG